MSAFLFVAALGLHAQNSAAPSGQITDVPGIRVGQYTLTERPTGCTVVLAPPNTVGAVDQRGGAPGTRETSLLAPENMVEVVHAIVLSGGSAYGLSTADGVMRYLSEQNIGYPVSGTVVPIVPAAILLDLSVGGNQRSDLGPSAVTTRLPPLPPAWSHKAQWAQAPVPPSASSPTIVP